MGRDQLSWEYIESKVAVGHCPVGHWAGVIEVGALMSAMPGSPSPVKELGAESQGGAAGQWPPVQGLGH